MNKLAAFGLALLWAAGANAQTAVQQTGPVTDNWPVMWSTDHHIRQAAGAAGDVAGKMLSGGLSTVGNVCSFSATTDQPHDKLCMSSNGTLIYNDVAYPLNPGGGNVLGPTPTTPGEFALWNNASGSLLKDGRALVGHSGGFQTTDTGTPPLSFVGEPSFGFTWKSANLFGATATATHSGEFWTTAAILNNSTGSGANGPASVDNTLVLGCARTAYLTTTVLGELGCQWSYLTQGAKGDAAVYLASLRHVDDLLNPNWGRTAVETDIEHVAPSTGTTIRRAHLSVGFGISGHQEITGVAAGAGGTCRIAVANTAPLDTTPAIGVTITGVQGTPECNGQWGFTKIDGTHIDLTNSKVTGTYSGGGSAGTSGYSLGGPNFGFEARASTGQNGVAFLVDRAVLPATGTWGSALRVRHENDWTVAFDMSANTGRFVVQPATLPSLVDEAYSATFLSGPIRWAGNTATMPRDPNFYPANTYPGGGALGFNFSAGSGEVDMWNLLTGALATFSLYQKLSDTTQKLMFQVSDAGSQLFTPFGLPTGGMVLGVPTGGYKGVGTLNVAGAIWANGTVGATCGPGSPTAAFRVVGGVVTVC